MPPTPQEIRAAQQASWNKFSPGWKKWDALTMAFLAPHGQAIVDHLRPAGTARILDIAAGTGEPGLTMARMLEGGAVVLTDLSDGMLRIARDKAAAAGISNVEFRQADACALPFDDGQFDAVSCRLGFMFFPDMEGAVREIARVLKPGGRVATTVWGGPERNSWVTCMMQGILRHIDVPAALPGAPGIFRCAQPGLLAGLFADAGLRDVSETVVPCRMSCGSAEDYWNMMTEVAAPVVAVLGTADAATVSRIKADVLAAMQDRHPEGTIDGCGVRIAAVK